MREIKFRAWDGDRMQTVLTLGLYEGFVSTNKLNSDIKDFVIMQFTGLKDKNSKEIYEGDVLKVPDWYDLPENTSMTYNNQEVSFADCSFSLGGTSMHEDYEYISEECEVIGNIYENPELLK